MGTGMVALRMGKGMRVVRMVKVSVPMQHFNCYCVVMCIIVADRNDEVDVEQSSS